MKQIVKKKSQDNVDIQKWRNLSFVASPANQKLISNNDAN